MQPDGTTPLAQREIGIQVFGGAGNQIGGTAAGAGNVISSNAPSGFSSTAASSTSVQGNLIGTDKTGTLDRGNLRSGILISPANNNDRRHRRRGRQHDRLQRDRRGRGRHRHRQLDPWQLDLLEQRLPERRPRDRSGRHQRRAVRRLAQRPRRSRHGRERSPELPGDRAGDERRRHDDRRDAQQHRRRLRITSTSTPAPAATRPASARGRSTSASKDVTTDGSGNESFSATFASVTVAPGDVVTATATDPAGNTSEFAQCATVNGGGGGGSLTGSRHAGSPVDDVNLSALGTEDWAIWGSANGGTSTSLAPNVAQARRQRDQLADEHRSGAVGRPARARAVRPPAAFVPFYLRLGERNDADERVARRSAACSTTARRST